MANSTSTDSSNAAINSSVNGIWVNDANNNLQFGNAAPILANGGNAVESVGITGVLAGSNSENTISNDVPTNVVINLAFHGVANGLASITIQNGSTVIFSQGLPAGVPISVQGGGASIVSNLPTTSAVQITATNGTLVMSPVNGANAAKFYDPAGVVNLNLESTCREGFSWSDSNHDDDFDGAGGCGAVLAGECVNSPYAIEVA